MSLPGGKRMKTGAWGTDAVGAANPGRSGPRTAGAHPGMAAAREAEIDLCRRAGRSRSIPDTGRVHTRFAHGGRQHRAAVLHRPEPAEHPDPHRGRQPHPPRLHRRAGACAGQRRLFADRAAPARPCRRHPGPAREFRARRGHPRAHRQRGVRRADGGHGPDDAAAREGDQFRHHLRHQRASAWRGSLAIAPGEARGYIDALFRALSRHPRLHGADEGGGAHRRLRR